MRLFTTIVMDGAIFAAVLFLISVGLTLVFGVLRILNVAHGGLYALGAFTATSLALWLLGLGGPPHLTYLMLLLAPVIVGLIAGPFIARAFLQRPAAESLVRAHRGLKPHGYGLLIHDGYRPWAITKLFWEMTSGKQREFVADPSQGSKHNRGCAVDLTLYDLDSGKVEWGE